jgi:hypothetical protein
MNPPVRESYLLAAGTVCLWLQMLASQSAKRENVLRLAVTGSTSNHLRGMNDAEAGSSGQTTTIKVLVLLRYLVYLCLYQRLVPYHRS